MLFETVNDLNIQPIYWEIMTMTSDNQQRAVQFLATVSSMYTNNFLSDSMFKEQFLSDEQALICFLKAYAYERQGAAPAYPKIAVKCIEQMFNRRKNRPNVPPDTEAEEAWKEYAEIAVRDFNLANNKERTIKINQMRNPLNTNGGILSKMASEKMASEHVTNIAVFVRDSIKCGNTKTAYDFIKSIRGVGAKISSFYLRDVACLANIDENKIDQLHLLQPIDTWIEQALHILINSSTNQKLEQKQKAILQLCKNAKVSSCSFNQGAWFFGSQIAKEFDTFKAAINDISKARNLLEDHMDEKEQYVNDLKRILDSLHKDQPYG